MGKYWAIGLQAASMIHLKRNQVTNILCGKAVFLKANHEIFFQGLKVLASRVRSLRLMVFIFAFSIVRLTSAQASCAETLLSPLEVIVTLEWLEKGSVEEKERIISITNSTGGGMDRGTIRADSPNEMTPLGDLSFLYQAKEKKLEIEYCQVTDRFSKNARTLNWEISAFAGQPIRRRGVSEKMFAKLFELFPAVAEIEGVLALENARLYFEATENKLQATPFYRAVSRYGFTKVILDQPVIEQIKGGVLKTVKVRLGRENYWKRGL